MMLELDLPLTQAEKLLIKPKLLDNLFPPDQPFETNLTSEKSEMCVRTCYLTLHQQIALDVKEEETQASLVSPIFALAIDKKRVLQYIVKLDDPVKPLLDQGIQLSTEERWKMRDQKALEIVKNIISAES